MWKSHLPQVDISQEELKALYRYDPETGFFYGKKKSTPLGYLDMSGYVKIRIKRRAFSAHRLAWLYMTGEWPKNIIHHKNRIRWDNRFCNLADVTFAENIEKRSDQGQCPDLYSWRGKKHTELLDICAAILPS